MMDLLTYYRLIWRAYSHYKNGLTMASKNDVYSDYCTQLAQIIHIAPKSTFYRNDYNSNLIINSY